MAVYVYDAVGNILTIQRIAAATLPGQVAISFVSPDRSRAGTGRSARRGLRDQVRA